MSNKNKDKDRELFRKAYEIASNKGQIKIGKGKYCDPERSGILDNYYHLISTQGKLLARIPLNQMHSWKPENNSFGNGCAVFIVGLGVVLLAAISLPKMLDVNPKAKSYAARNTLSIIAKECAVKIRDKGEGFFVVPEIYGYKLEKNNNAGFYLENNRKLSGSTINCPTKGEIKIVSEDESKNPTFSYNLDTGKKICTAESGTEAEKLCANDTW